MQTLRPLLLCGLLIPLVGLAACGGTQSPNTDANGQRTIDRVFNPEGFETITFESAIRSRNLASFGNAVYTREPVYRFRTTEARRLEIIAQNDDSDMILLVTGPELPYQDDDTYGTNPSIKSTFPPGEYAIYVGRWGYPDRDTPFELSIYDSTAGQKPDLEPNADVVLAQETEAEVSTSAEFAAEYADAPTPNQDAWFQIDASQVESQQRNVTLTFSAQTPSCNGIFDFNRPVAQIEHLDKLGDKKLRIVLNRSDDGPAYDTAMAIYQGADLVACSDDFLAFYAGKDLGATDGAQGPLTVYGGVVRADIIPEDDTLKVGFGIETLSATQWQTEPQRIQPKDTTQSAYIKGMPDVNLNTLDPEYYSWIRDADRPDVTVHVSKRGTDLQIDGRLHNSDAVLFVQKPDGSSEFNDDRPGSMDARIAIQDAPTGTYSIWLGTFQSGVSMSGLIDVKATSNRRSAATTSVHTLGERASLQVQAASPTRTAGNSDICEGFSSGYLDTRTPSAVIRNDSGQDVYLALRSHASFDTMLYARGDTESCGDDEAGLDGVAVVEIKAGGTADVFVGSTDSANAKKRIELRYMLLTEEMGLTHHFIDFIEP